MREDAVVADGFEVVVVPFDDFYRLNYRSALGVAQALTGDRGRAEEIVQESFLIAQRRWARVGLYDRPDLWMRRVVINRCISMRKRLANEFVAINRLAGRSPAIAPVEAATDETLWRAVRRLPRAQAAVIVLVYVDDMTIERAAQTLGIGTPTAKTHLRRAKDRLANWLTEGINND